MSKTALGLILASPLISIQLVKLITFALQKLNDLMMDAFPANTLIVQSAIELTSTYSNAITIALCAYIIYFIRSRSKSTELRKRVLHEEVLAVEAGVDGALKPDVGSVGSH